jgi:thiol-disulfide isomerase/thioredoxin
MKKTAIIIVAGILALVLGISARQLPDQKTAPANLPGFNLPDLSGRQHNITEWQGKVLVINFWATWCSPCRKEIPDFIALQQQYADKGLQFVGIALEDKAPVADYMAANPISYPVLLGGDDGIALAQQLGNTVGAIPFTVIVDRQGKIVDQHPGEFDKEQLTKIIAPLLN